MLFNSIEFFVFFPIVTALFYVVSPQWRWGLLLVASYVFYMAWEPGYVVLLWLSTAVDYAAGRLMAGCPDRASRRPYLFLSLAANLGLLFFFKYYNFFREAIEACLAPLGWHPFLPRSEFLLPVGISFYTFQTLSYTIEVYRGTMAAERHAGRFALYVAFFPQLVAGPIERAQGLLPQLFRLDGCNYDGMRRGLQLMAWGMFKKVVIADRLAEFVNPIYSEPGQFTGFALTLATVFFAFQIYCDFSGYTDIAIGAAEMLGVRLMQNFNRPYFAVSIAEFWRRWHISLSTWFRDYVYVPLGGNRVSPLRWRVNIAAVFVLSGLWHGANWTFLIWGVLHAVYMVVGTLTGRYRAALWRRTGLLRAPGLQRAVQALVTFSLVCFAWIFFRAERIDDAMCIVTRLHTGWGALVDPTAFMATLYAIACRLTDFALMAALIAILLSVHAAQTRIGLRDWVNRQVLPIRWTIYSAGLWVLFLLGMFERNEFIYFTF